MKIEISKQLVDSVLRLPCERAGELITELSEAHGVVYGHALLKALFERTYKGAL